MISRDEAIRDIGNWLSLDSDGYDVLERDIYEIYDQFDQEISKVRQEAQKQISEVRMGTCDGCKYFKPLQPFMPTAKCKIIGLNVPKDFGCNKFKPKTNK